MNVELVDSLFINKSNNYSNTKCTVPTLHIRHIGSTHASGLGPVAEANNRAIKVQLKHTVTNVQ